MTNIRPPAYAGSFYPENEKELESLIDEYLDQAEPPLIEGEVRAIVLPHAGYVYSGPIAAFGHKLVEKKDYDNVILFGPSHKVMFSGIALTNYSTWRTPLGIVNLSSLSKDLEAESGFSLVNEAHLFEHSIEVQLPFLQKVLKEFKITPLVTGRVSNHEEIAETLNKYIDEKTLIIVSSDLCHYLPFDEAVKQDKETIKKIIKYDTFIEPEQACGIDGILILLELARMNRWKVQLLDYRNSGDTSGDKSQVVGYASIAFYK